MTDQKILILYKSVTGFTKEYAEKLANKTGAACIPLKGATAEALSGFDTVVFGGRLHAGTLDGLKRAKALFGQSRANRFLVFATGACPNEATATIEEMWHNNFSPAELSEIPHFYMQAGLRYENMPPIDRLMMKGLRSFLAKKKEKNESERQMEAMIAGSFDISSEKYLAPLLDALDSSVAVSSGIC